MDKDRESSLNGFWGKTSRILGENIQSTARKKRCKKKKKCI